MHLDSLSCYDLGNEFAARDRVTLGYFVLESNLTFVWNGAPEKILELHL